MLLRSLSALAFGSVGRDEQPGAVLDRDDLAADRRALNVGVEHRQEDADPRHRLVGEVELGGRDHLVDQA